MRQISMRVEGLIVRTRDAVVFNGTLFGFSEQDDGKKSSSLIIWTSGRDAGYVTGLRGGLTGGWKGREVGRWKLDERSFIAVEPADSRSSAAAVAVLGPVGFAVRKKSCIITIRDAALVRGIVPDETASKVLQQLAMTVSKLPILNGRFGSQMPSAAAPPTESLPTALAKLAELFESGFLNDQEFAEAKRRLLAAE